MPPLPRTSHGALPIKATLLVAPAALLPQWESELRKHTAEGELRYATYVGLALATPPPRARRAAVRSPPPF